MGNNAVQNKEDKELKNFLNKLIGRWPLFIIFGVLGVLVGMLVSKFKIPTYSITSTLLIEDQGNDMSKLTGLFGNFSSDFKPNINDNVDNQIGILKSYSLSYEALSNINTRITWFEKGTLKNNELYKKDPFVIELSNNGNVLPQIPVYIRIKSGDHYELSAKGKIMFAKGKTESSDIEFKQEGTFGKLFKNRYCQMVIQRPTSFYQPEKTYFFVINDIAHQAKEYTKNLKIDLANKKADIINIQVEGTVPEKEIDFINELNQMLIKFRATMKAKTSENSLDFINLQMKGISDSLKMAELRYSDYRSANKIIDLDEEAKAVLDKLKELETQRFQLKLQLDYYKNLQKYMTNTDKLQQIASPSVVGIADVTLNSLLEKLIDLYSRKRTTSVAAKENSSVIQILDEEIRATNKSITANVENLEQNAEIQLHTLNKQIQITNEKMANMPQIEQKYIKIKRQFDLNNDIYTFMLQKKAEVGITNASNVSDVHIIDPARIETVEKTGPKTSLNIMLGLILGLGIPFLYLLLTEYTNTKIQGKEDIEDLTILPLVGSIFNSSNNSNIFVTQNMRSRVTESFRQLRTQLKFFQTTSNAKVICIQSVMPNEGKSFIACNLASIFALQNKKVLLVDADMRKDGLSKFLLSDLKKDGLSNYLIDKSSIKDVIRQIEQVPNLSFVPSGEIPPNSTELLENSLEKFLREVKLLFDYIIIDNAPIIVSDGLITGAMADINLFVTRFRFTHKKQIEIIDGIVKQNSLKNVGIVLNDMKISRKYGNNYYYGYGNYYYKENDNKINGKKLSKVKGQEIEI